MTNVFIYITVLFRFRKEFSLSNFKVSKEVTITPIENKENDEIISKLKKLTNITFDIVKPEPVFKIPIISNLKKIVPKKTSIHNNILGISESKILSENRNTSTDKNPVVIDNGELSIKKCAVLNKTPKKLQQNKVHCSTPFKKITSNKMIENKSNIVPKKCLLLQKNNTPRTNYPKKYSQQSPRVKKTPNNFKLVEKSKPLHVPNISCDADKVMDNNSCINISETNIKTEYSANQDYTLTDLSTRNHKVISAVPLDFMNDCIPEYDNFVMGINTSSSVEPVKNLEISQNYEKDTLIEKDMTGFSDFLSNINCQRQITLHSTEENYFFENIQNDQLFNINKINGSEIQTLENSQKSISQYTLKNYEVFEKHTNNDINTNSSTISINNKLSQITDNYFSNDLVEKNANRDDHTIDYNSLNNKEYLNVTKDLSDGKNLKNFSRQLPQIESNKRIKIE